MSALEECKKAGLKNLDEMAKISNVKERTLYNWFKKNHQGFTILLLGCVTNKFDGNGELNQEHKDILDYLKKALKEIGQSESQNIKLKPIPAKKMKRRKNERRK